MIAPPRLIGVPSYHARVREACLFGLLLVAAWLVNPDRPLPFDVCLWKQITGWPCLTCGLTRAVCHALHGHIVTSFSYHPAGIAAAGWLLWKTWSSWTAVFLRKLERS